MGITESIAKLKYVDALRGIAVLGVLMVHCLLYGTNKYVPSYFSHGGNGVQLFYIVSAFTLFRSMKARFIHERHAISSFFIRRFFRIAPMYYLSIAYYLWQDGLGKRYWLGDADHVTIANIFSNIFFVHGLNPYWINSVVPGGWSIAIEALFYCLIPVLFLKIKNSQQALNLLLITLALRLALNYLLSRIHIIDSPELWSGFLFFYLPNQLPIFVLGIFYYFILEENHKTLFSPFLTIITSIILIGQFAGLPILPDHFLFGVAFVILSIGLSKVEFKALVNPVTTYIGKISFSMYLVHVAVLHWMERLGFVDFISVSGTYTGIVNYCIRLLILIATSVLVSTFFYQIIEIPMQELGKRFINRLNK